MNAILLPLCSTSVNFKRLYLSFDSSHGFGSPLQDQLYLSPAEAGWTEDSDFWGESHTEEDDDLSKIFPSANSSRIVTITGLLEVGEFESTMFRAPTHLCVTCCSVSKRDVQ